MLLIFGIISCFLGYHEIPEENKVVMFPSRQITDKSSHKVILPGNQIVNTSNESSSSTSVSDTGSASEYVSSDVKFGIAIGFGFVIIFVLMVIIPKVRYISFICFIHIRIII